LTGILERGGKRREREIMLEGGCSLV
jgi:hypothetical protein